jgi:GTPase Era involved in 16S rRNA processing
MQIATGQNADTVSHELQSRRPAIRAVEVVHPISKELLILVDTPGLDDTKLDIEIMTTMTAWLRKQ